MTEADEFYAAVQGTDISPDQRQIQRQVLAGMIWTKQFFYYNVEQWLQGDPAQPEVPPSRAGGRNHEWEHLNNFDVISMPDKWEYPWYAAWDLAFHAIPLALVDTAFAKRQLNLMDREWYMHPNGTLPAYEWKLGDVNPPVHAWAAWRVYKIDAKQQGRADTQFLEGMFHKLLMNFTWWVNKKDGEGRNVFQGGFLGLDNISVFDRSAPLPTGGHIDQSDGTAWMGFYCLVLLKIALALAKEDPVYQDTAGKFFEHFLRIARAMTGDYRGGLSLWDEEDGFFYDALHLPDGSLIPLKVRSLVGLMPLLAVETLEHDLVERLPVFKRRLNWFFKNRIYLRDHGNVACVRSPGEHSRRLLSIVNRDRLVKVLKPMLDEKEFLSPYGIRSVSKFHQDHPYTFHVDGQAHTIGYQPAESRSGLFGGNSNWRGPIWFPINYLLIESLQKFNHYYGDSLKVECLTGSGRMMNLGEVATELSRRLTKMFLRNGNGERPIYRFASDEDHGKVARKPDGNAVRWADFISPLTSANEQNLLLQPSIPERDPDLAVFAQENLGVCGVSPLDEHNTRFLDFLHPKAWVDPKPKSSYNLVVIGAGAGGLVSGAGAAGVGARVVLIEAHLLGGDCLTVGCVPSRAHLQAKTASKSTARPSNLPKRWWQPAAQPPSPIFRVSRKRPISPMQLYSI